MRSDMYRFGAFSMYSTSKEISTHQLSVEGDRPSRYTVRTHICSSVVSCEPHCYSVCAFYQTNEQYIFCTRRNHSLQGTTRQATNYWKYDYAGRIFHLVYKPDITKQLLTFLLSLAIHANALVDRPQVCYRAPPPLERVFPYQQTTLRPVLYPKKSLSVWHSSHHEDQKYF